MLKNICRLESKIEDKVGHFFVDHDTPLHIVKEMLFQFQKYVGQIEDYARKQETEKQSEEVKSDG